MKHAIITGGAMSIGFETAKQLVSQGVGVSLIDISETALTKAFVVLGSMVDTYIADVSKSSDVERVISEIVKKHPNISYIVNYESDTRGSRSHVNFLRIHDKSLLGFFRERFKYCKYIIGARFYYIQR